MRCSGRSDLCLPMTSVCVWQKNLLCESRAPKKSSKKGHVSGRENRLMVALAIPICWECRKDAKAEAENQSGKKPERLHFSLVGV